MGSFIFPGGGPGTDGIIIVIAGLIAGAVLVLAAYGLYAGWLGFLALDEATGVWLMLFLILLVIIDIFLSVHTLRAWERPE